MKGWSCRCPDRTGARVSVRQAGNFVPAAARPADQLTAAIPRRCHRSICPARSAPAARHSVRRSVRFGTAEDGRDTCMPLSTPTADGGQAAIDDDGRERCRRHCLATTARVLRANMAVHEEACRPNVELFADVLADLDQVRATIGLTGTTPVRGNARSEGVPVARPSPGASALPLGRFSAARAAHVQLGARWAGLIAKRQLKGRDSGVCWPPSMSLGDSRTGPPPASLHNAPSLDLYELSLAISQMMTDPKSIFEVRRHLHLGAHVMYFDHRRGTLAPGPGAAVGPSSHHRHHCHWCVVVRG